MSESYTSNRYSPMHCSGERRARQCGCEAGRPTGLHGGGHSAALLVYALVVDRFQTVASQSACSTCPVPACTILVHTAGKCYLYLEKCLWDSVLCSRLFAGRMNLIMNLLLMDCYDCEMGGPVPGCL